MLREHREGRQTVASGESSQKSTHEWQCGRAQHGQWKDEKFIRARARGGVGGTKPERLFKDSL